VNALGHAFGHEPVPGGCIGDELKIGEVVGDHAVDLLRHRPGSNGFGETLEHGTRLRAGSLRLDTEIHVGRRNAEFLEKTLRHPRIVVLAGMDQDLFMIAAQLA
jgi:hypothetical protein